MLVLYWIYCNLYSNLL